MARRLQITGVEILDADVDNGVLLSVSKHYTGGLA